MGTILSLVPTNIVASMAKGDMLPIIFFSVLFGLGLSSLPATHREPLVTVFRSISETMFQSHPYGDALCAGRGVRPDFSDPSPPSGSPRCGCWAAGAAGLLCDPVLRAGGAGDCRAPVGLSIWILIRILKDELILAYSTASPESVLPRIIEKMEAYGAPASITSFVVPTGYSFNLDGSTLYQSIAAILSPSCTASTSIWQEITLVLDS